MLLWNLKCNRFNDYALINFRMKHESKVYSSYIQTIISYVTRNIDCTIKKIKKNNEIYNGGLSFHQSCTNFCTITFSPQIYFYWQSRSLPGSFNSLVLNSEICLPLSISLPIGFSQHRCCKSWGEKLGKQAEQQNENWSVIGAPGIGQPPPPCHLCSLHVTTNRSISLIDLSAPFPRIPRFRTSLSASSLSLSRTPTNDHLPSLLLVYHPAVTVSSLFSQHSALPHCPINCHNCVSPVFWLLDRHFLPTCVSVSVGALPMKRWRKIEAQSEPSTPSKVRFLCLQKRCVEISADSVNKIFDIVRQCRCGRVTSRSFTRS